MNSIFSDSLGRVGIESNEPEWGCESTRICGLRHGQAKCSSNHINRKVLEAFQETDVPFAVKKQVSAQKTFNEKSWLKVAGQRKMDGSD